MFRRLTLIFALLFALGIGRLSAQELQLKSFELNVMDAAAKTREVLDLAGNPCALLRVFVAVDDVDFKGNLGIRGEVLHARNSEYVMYIPAGSTSITVNAQGFLPFTYTFNQKIEGHKTYVLYLLVPESGPKKHKVETNYVTLEVSPENATVLIDNMVHPLTEGALAAELSLGNHTYRVAAPQYHTQTGSFEIVATETTSLKIDLKPAFGWLDVEVSPVGATVMIDSEVKGTSPCKIKLESGNYFMQLLSEGYIAYGENISITDGETKPVRPALKANFAQITIQAPYPHSEIWLRGEKVATGRWSGRLNAGTYAVESRTEGYEPCKENISVTAEDSRTFTLQMPTPIYSMVKINTTPFGAEVKLDGKVVGKTPWQSNEVLAGRHTLELSKEGYETHRETLTLARDAVSSINPTLKKQTSASASTGTTTAGAASSSIASTSSTARTSGTALTYDDLFPLYGVSLDKSTQADLRKMGHNVKDMKDGDFVCWINDTRFWTFDDDSNIFEQVSISASYLPDPWKEFGFNATLTDEQFAVLLKGLGFQVKWLKKNKCPYVKALSSDGKVLLELEFEASGKFDEITARTRGKNSNFDYVWNSKGDKGSEKTVPNPSPSATAYTTQSTHTSGTASSGTEKSYQVGDYYNENGKEGVVFEVDATGKHGKIVSLRGTYNEWTTNDNEQKRTIGATDKYDGRKNMEAVKRISNWRSLYPAFAWCTDLGEGWYIPAIEELKIFALNKNNRAIINKTLSEYGEIMVNEKDIYSSTESGDKYSGVYQVYYIYPSNSGASGGFENDQCKYVDSYFRAIARF